MMPHFVPAFFITVRLVGQAWPATGNKKCPQLTGHHYCSFCGLLVTTFEPVCRRSQGKDYKTFSIAVLMLAFDYDKSKKDIALKISYFADKLGDKETANKYKTLGGR
ncbi:hypothetical protein A3860_37015 [Niastella vici]|uniref:Uncharacterized protein n=1 Tax=Niastella vici TaxID=1703345 RepID=A0A1V9FMM2_9BACT|nr:hypothetical protein [Niastella vici]OQP59593.1 hypothetical protein A3860_37015 [Niastella vici]